MRKIRREVTRKVGKIADDLPSRSSYREQGAAFHRWLSDGKRSGHHAIDESYTLYDPRCTVIESRNDEITWIRIITFDCCRHGRLPGLGAINTVSQELLGKTK